MKFARADLVTYLGEKTLHTSDPQLLANEVAAYLLEQNHVDELESVLRDVMAYRQAHGIVEADVASAHELDNQTMRDVKTLLEQQFPNATQIILHNSTDPSIIGGLRIRLAHQQLDMSVRSKLDIFRRLTTEGIV